MTFDEPLREVLLQTEDLEWVEKSLAGLSHKMLWRDPETEASIALVRFEQGSGIPSEHKHASNQFMFCLSGRYVYLPTGTTLTKGSFYWNPKGVRARADARRGDLHPAGGVRRPALPGAAGVLRQRRGRPLTWPAGTSTPT